MNDGEKQHWLDSTRNVYKVIYGVYGLYIFLLLLDLLHYHRHPHFRLDRVYGLSDDWFGFYALFGLAACIGLVYAAKVLRWLLMRDEDYYDE